MGRPRVAVCLLLALVGLCGFAEHKEGRSAGPEKSNLERGREVYAANCAICHGVRGEGNGRGASEFRRPCQSFQAGRFKFRSTRSGSLPVDNDLFRTITQGVPWTGMVPHSRLDEADRWAVVSHMKMLSPRFQTERQGAPISIPPEPTRTPGLTARGRLMYQEAGCTDCHGEGGRGDGPSSASLKDDWGVQIPPSDLSLMRLPRKSGPTAIDLYRTIATGLDGTPMPSYADSLTPEDIWAIVAYLYALPPEIEWAGLPEGEGAELVRWRCTLCHSMEGRGLQRLDGAGWTETVDRMIRFGTPLAAREREIVIRYLIKHFGAARSP